MNPSVLNASPLPSEKPKHQNHCKIEQMHSHTVNLHDDPGDGKQTAVGNLPCLPSFSKGCVLLPPAKGSSCNLVSTRARQRQRIWVLHCRLLLSITVATLVGAPPKHTHFSCHFHATQGELLALSNCSLPRGSEPEESRFLLHAAESRLMYLPHFPRPRHARWVIRAAVESLHQFRSRPHQISLATSGSGRCWYFARRSAEKSRRRFSRQLPYPQAAATSVPPGWEVGGSLWLKSEDRSLKRL